MISRSRLVRLGLAFFMTGFSHVCNAQSASPPAGTLAAEIPKLRLAVEDLLNTFGRRYPRGDEFLSRLEELQATRNESTWDDFVDLRREALLANPLLDGQRILLVKRMPRDMTPGQPPDAYRDFRNKHPNGTGVEIGLPSNHECNSSLPRLGWNNEIAVLSMDDPEGPLETVYRHSGGGYVGELDLHRDAEKILITQSDSINWKILEISLDGRNVRQVSRMPDDVDCMDACYLPDGRIVFGSTASYQSVPCWHGCRRVNNLYIMDHDGGHVRQVCFDQDHDFHPCVLSNGQVLYNRWDYTGITHIYLRQLMVMNPDGTGQRAVYGTNSWYPNSLYFSRPLPGQSSRLISILSGYHGVHRMGQLVLLDTNRGWTGTEGMVQRISGKGTPIDPRVKDALVDGDWPKFLHPFPISDRHFLVSALEAPNGFWGIYLADAFDHLIPIREEPGWALLEPILLSPVSPPRQIPDRVSLDRTDATVYLQDVYKGKGMQGVPRGLVKRLRVLAYHFGYRGLAGPDKIGYGGPWEAMRILGTVPVQADGSALFRVPANTPIAVQPLDKEGKAVQLMRSWFTAMPGEVVSCVGCHETPGDAGGSGMVSAAMKDGIAEIEEWYGPPRGFDFAREVQPVLDRYCVTCHHGAESAAPDLRAEEDAERIESWPIGYVSRLHPGMLEATGGRMRYTPGYDALIHFIRRVGVEDDVSLLSPGEYHANTSELIQMLAKGHYGVELDREAWDRFVTWIDLNGPCHGTWGDVFPIPDGAHERRMELRRMFGGPMDDPEAIPELPDRDVVPQEPRALSRPEPLSLPGWPWSTQEAIRMQGDQSAARRLIDLGDGIMLTLVRIPAGAFPMGDSAGAPDEWPEHRVEIEEPFWMGVCEVTNQQFNQFMPGHDSGYYCKRRPDADSRGVMLNEEFQPATRVSWKQAMAFCAWLSERTGEDCTLPTEAQWEYACRAGTNTAFHFGALEDDYSSWANLADLSFSRGLMDVHGSNMPEGGATQVTGGVPHMVLEGARNSDRRYSDGMVATAAVGRYKPNAWGLHDMHGNVAEWTRSEYRPFLSQADEGTNQESRPIERVVRGGSFFDRPARARSAFRLGYPDWQPVFNVGFRIVCRGRD